MPAAISSAAPSPWMKACAQKRAEWEEFKAARYQLQTLYDKTWGRAVLTQPAVIKVATDWVKANGAVGIFDAGDVQGCLAAGTGGTGRRRRRPSR